MPELLQLLLALAVFALAVALFGAWRRAGRRAVAFGGLVVADLGLCGLALRQPEPHGPLLWVALGGAVLLVALPRWLAGLQTAAVRADDLPRALRLQRWRGWLQPGAHDDGVHVLEELGRRGGARVAPAGLGLARDLLRPGLDPSLRLRVLEAIFDELAASGRAAELLTLLEAEGGESLLAFSPRIAASAASCLAAAGRMEEARRAEAVAAQQPAAPQRTARGEVPVHRLAPVSLLLIATITAIHGLLTLLGPADENTALVRFGGNYPALTLHGEPWRLLSSVFLHGGFFHLLVNAYALYNLGRFVEPLYGSARLFIIYVVAGISGSAASALLGQTERLSVGASGAIFGLLGAALVALLRLRGVINERWRQQVLWNLLVVVALNLWIGYSVKVVDNWAHLGGLAGGAAVGLLLAPRPGRALGRSARLFERSLAALLLATLAATAFAVLVTPTSRSEGRLAWRTVERGGLSVEVPVSVVEVPASAGEGAGSTGRGETPRGLAFQDPLLRLRLVAAVGLAARGSLEAERDFLEADLGKELAGETGGSQVERLRDGALPVMGPPGTRQAAWQLPDRGEPSIEVLLLRGEGDLVLLLRARLPAAKLPAVAPMLRRMFTSLRYRASGS